MYPLLEFHRYNKIYIFISFTKTKSRAQKSLFLKFLKNKMQKNIFKKILTFKFFVQLFVCFIFLLLETDGKCGQTKTFAV